jgi:hypothetical protein
MTGYSFTYAGLDFSRLGVFVVPDSNSNELPEPELCETQVPNAGTAAIIKHRKAGRLSLTCKVDVTQASHVDSGSSGGGGFDSGGDLVSLIDAIAVHLDYFDWQTLTLDHIPGRTFQAMLDSAVEAEYIDEGLLHMTLQFILQPGIGGSGS